MSGPPKISKVEPEKPKKVEPEVIVQHIDSGDDESVNDDESVDGDVVVDYNENDDEDNDNRHDNNTKRGCLDDDGRFEKGNMSYKIGQIIDVRIVSIFRKGIKVQTNHASGWISIEQVLEVGMDIAYANQTFEFISKKYEVGQETKARVLEIDPETKSLSLTMKPTLMFPNLKILSKYEDAILHNEYKGVILKIYKYTFLVLFFGGVKAILVEAKGRGLKIGDIVSCIVEKVDAQNRKMTCRLRS